MADEIIDPKKVSESLMMDNQDDTCNDIEQRSVDMVIVPTENNECDQAIDGTKSPTSRQTTSNTNYVLIPPPAKFKST